MKTTKANLTQGTLAHRNSGTPMTIDGLIASAALDLGFGGIWRGLTGDGSQRVRIHNVT